MTYDPAPRSSLMCIANLVRPTALRETNDRDIDVAQEVLGYIAGLLDEAGHLPAADYLRQLRADPSDDDGDYPHDADSIAQAYADPDTWMT